MSYPTVEIGEKKIILLSGFERACGTNKTVVITAKDQLKAAAKRDSDAVAFGYVSGMWFACRMSERSRRWQYWLAHPPHVALDALSVTCCRICNQRAQ